jgi:hypothetical protein
MTGVLSESAKLIAGFMQDAGGDRAGSGWSIDGIVVRFSDLKHLFSNSNQYRHSNPSGLPKPAIVATTYDYLTIKGAGSAACFFNRLAAFFSFGVNKACFFPSLLERLDLDMMYLLVRN